MNDFTISYNDLAKLWSDGFKKGLKYGFKSENHVFSGFDYDGDVTKIIPFNKEDIIMKAKKETMKNITEFIRLGHALGLDDLDAALERLQEEMEDLNEEKETETKDNPKAICEVVELPGEVRLIKDSYSTASGLDEFHFWFLNELKEKGFVTLKDVFPRINMGEEEASEKCSMYGWTSFPFIMNYEEKSLLEYHITMKKHPERMFYRAFQAANKELAEELFDQILLTIEMNRFITEDYLFHEIFSIEMDQYLFSSMGWRSKKSFRLIDNTIYILSDNMSNCAFLVSI